MAHRIDITHRVEEEIDTLAGNVKGVKWQIGAKEDLDRPIVSIELQKGSSATLSRLCSRVEGERQAVLQGTLKKINQKLEFAERIVDFVTTNSEDVDPRIEKLKSKMQKLSKFNADTPSEERRSIERDLKRCSERILGLTHANPNRQTQVQLKEVQKTLNANRLKLLQIEPEVRIYRDRSQNAAAQYQELENVDIESCLQMGNTGVVAQHIVDSLQDENGGHYAYFVFDQGHREVARYIKEKIKKDEDAKQAPTSVSILELMKAAKKNRYYSSLDRLASVPVPPDLQDRQPGGLNKSGFSFASKESVEGLNAQFKLLQELRTSNKLDTMAAALTLGRHHFSLTFYSDGRVSLFNLSGDQNTCDKELEGLDIFEGNTKPKPYSITFGSQRQAVEFLHGLLAEKIGEEEGLAELPVAVTPICNKDHLRKELDNEEGEQDIDGYYGYPDNPLGAVPTEYRLKPALPSLNYLVPPAAALQKIVDALAKRSEEGFFESIAAILELNAFACEFPMTDATTERPIADRIYFHLYHIQDKETPGKVNRADVNHGSTAFQTDELTTPEERLRAAQRVQVELLLFVLQEAINRKDQNIITEILQTIERMNLDAKDLPKDQKNLAHTLFGKLYAVYMKAWESDRDMVHPHDKSFNGDFGRNAFVGGASASVSNEFKLQALQEIVASLKETWKI